jgi:nicotinamidase-related amidase
MVQNFKLSKKNTGLLVIDVQEKLVPLLDRSVEVIQAIQKVIKGFQVMGIPIIATEQYPQGLGPIIAGIKAILGPNQIIHSKNSFSCLGNPETKNLIMQTPVQQWVLIGIEAHVCVLQTAKDLLQANKDVVVLNDAITSRSVYDFSTAIAEMRDIGVRVSSTETVLFELLENFQAPEFKKISQLIK